MISGPGECAKGGGPQDQATPHTNLHTCPAGFTNGVPCGADVTGENRGKKRGKTRAELLPRPLFLGRRFFFCSAVEMVMRNPTPLPLSKKKGFLPSPLPSFLPSLSHSTYTYSPHEVALPAKPCMTHFGSWRWGDLSNASLELHKKINILRKINHVFVRLIIQPFFFRYLTEGASRS